MNFTAMPFMLLEVRKSIQGWRALYFYGIVMAVVPMLLFRAGLGAALDNKSGVAQKKRSDRVAALRASQQGSVQGVSPQVPDVDIIGKEAKDAAEELPSKLSSENK